MIARLRKILGMRRIGHLGTLDPAAAGVLPIALGDATRLIEYVPHDKSYRATIHLGVTTDTLDAEGQVLATADASGVRASAVEHVLRRFVGDLAQIPPMASALHHEGKRLYELFRRGEQVPLEPRMVRIDRIELLRFDNPHLEIDVDCGAGTYIRSLARDIGEALGCGAHLAGLVRTRSGPFRLADSVTCEQVAALADEQRPTLLVPLRRVLATLPWRRLTPPELRTILNGGKIPAGGEDQDAGSDEFAAADLGADSVCVLSADDAAVVGIGKVNAERVIAPVKVLASAQGG